MGDLLQKGNAWLQGKRSTSMAHLVTYWRGQFSVELLATAGETVWEVEQTEAVMLDTNQRDYLIATDELIIDGETITPLAGDRIKETLGADVAVFEVAAPFDEPPWRYSDRDRLTLRVHTKAVDNE